jgi:hypothetical protein
VAEQRREHLKHSHAPTLMGVHQSVFARLVSEPPSR